MARSNLQIAVGSYTGDGVDNRSITGVGFRPDLIIVKGGANVAMLRTRDVRGDSTSYIVGGSANSANMIQEIMNDGFQVGTGANVNTNGTTYYYVALRGNAAQTYFRTGRYYGDGLDNRNITGGGLGFTPDIVHIKGDVAQQGALRHPSIAGDNCTTLSNSTGSSNQIQNVQSGGFQIGTNARINNSGSEFFYFALKTYSGYIAAGSFTGDGTDDRSITGVGFTPDVVILKNRATADAGVIRTSSMAGDLSASLTSTAPTTNLIQALLSDGFQVGSDVSVNGTGNAIDWIALKAGSIATPITRTAV